MRSLQTTSLAVVLLTALAARTQATVSESTAIFGGSTLGEYVAAKFGGRPAAERLTQRLADSRHAYVPVLILLGDPRGHAAQQFFKSEYDNLSLSNDFLLVAIDLNDIGDAIAGRGIAIPAEDDATLAILNADGTLVAQTSFAELGDVSGFETFMKDRLPPLPNAGAVLADALAEARRDDKSVLVQVGAPWCGWCVVLSRFLEAHKDLISKDYVHVHLDERMAEAPKIIEGLGWKAGDGLPWMVILDSEGRPLVTSNAEGGNFGYPHDEGSRAHFDKMLRETRKRLTDEDLAALRKALEDAPVTK